jgi:predicted RNA-binding Zn ribbon-like protein
MLIDPEVMPAAVLVDLVNDWGSAPRREAQEESLPFPSPASIAERVAIELPDALVSERRLRRLADALYPVFATEDPQARAALVTDLMSHLRVRPAVVAVGNRMDEAWEVRAADVLAAAAVLTLRAQLIARGPDRLGTCAGVRCGDVFVDSSPAGHRRYCSITCQNRNRVAAFRRRLAARSDAGNSPQS